MPDKSRLSIVDWINPIRWLIQAIKFVRWLFVGDYQKLKVGMKRKQVFTSTMDLTRVANCEGFSIEELYNSFKEFDLLNNVLTLVQKTSKAPNVPKIGAFWLESKYGTEYGYLYVEGKKKGKKRQISLPFNRPFEVDEAIRIESENDIFPVGSQIKLRKNQNVGEEYDLFVKAPSDDDFKLLYSLENKKIAGSTQRAVKSKNNPKGLFVQKPNSRFVVASFFIALVIGFLAFLNRAEVQTWMSKKIFGQAPKVKKIDNGEAALADPDFYFTSRVKGHVAFPGMPEALRDVLFDSPTNLTTKKLVRNRQQAVIYLMDTDTSGTAKMYLLKFNKEIQDGDVTLTVTEQKIQDILSDIYLAQLSERNERLRALTDDDKKMLKNELGWFAQLMLTPKTMPFERKAFIGELWWAYMSIFAGLGIVLLYVLLGTVLGIRRLTYLLLAEIPKMKPNPQPKIDHVGAIAIWLLYMSAMMSTVVLAVGIYAPRHQLMATSLVFLSSLYAMYRFLRWRGHTWEEVKADVGLKTYDSLPTTLWRGVNGCFNIFILFVIGSIIHAYMLWFGHYTYGVQPVIEVAYKTQDWYVLFSLAFLATFAAGVTEEVPFRGLGLRVCIDYVTSFLRSFFARKVAILISAIISALVISIAFGMLHPGMIGLPVLIAIAIGLSIYRYYYDNTYICMVMHATHNAIMFTYTVLLIRNLL